MKCPNCGSINVAPYAYTLENDDKQQMITMLCYNCSYIGHRRKYTTWEWDTCDECYCEKDKK